MNVEEASNLRVETQTLDRQGLGRRLVANTAANLGGQTLILLLVFWTTPYLIHHFGPDLYGVFVLLLTSVEFFSLIDLGINPSLVKYVAERLPQGRIEDINRYVGTALTLFLIAGAVIAVGLALSADWIVRHVLNVAPALHRSVVMGFWIAGVTFLFRFTGQAFSAIPIATQRFDVANAVNVGTESFRLVGSVLLVSWGYLLEGVLLVTLVATLASGAANLVIARRLIPGLSWRPRFSAGHFREIVHFSKFVVIANLSGRVVHSLDKMIVAYFLPVASVAFYAVPYALSQRLWALVGNVTAVVFPAASALSGAVSGPKLHELYVRGSKIVAAAAGFPAAALCLLSGELLQYWIGPEFSREGALVLRLLSLGFLVNCLGHVPYVMIQATGRPEVAARFAGLNGLINLVLFLLLIPPFGIVGAAAGFLGAQMIVIPWFIHRVNLALGTGWRDLVRRAYAPVLAATACGCLVVVALRPLVGSLPSLVLVGGAGLLAYLMAAAVLILDQRERSACLEFLDKRRLSPGHLRRS